MQILWRNNFLTLLVHSGIAEQPDKSVFSFVRKLSSLATVCFAFMLAKTQSSCAHVLASICILVSASEKYPSSRFNWYP